MRLLNLWTARLEEFLGRDIPKYAILSHTWGAEEILYADIVNSTPGITVEGELATAVRRWLSDGPEAYHGEELRSKSGYNKLRGCCVQALRDGYDYIWDDTCCIDKTSSAELSEAINSMFHWYQEADVCFAYLEDVPSGQNPGDDTQAPKNFSQSRWFTRGWTLQELIAPSQVIFFYKDWEPMGTRMELATAIFHITGIDEALLARPSTEAWDHRLSAYSNAQKMSWAANRETSRTEDIAYSLLGLFDVNMPLLYGEGKKAFKRLQEEIIRTSTDESILAWAFFDDDWANFLSEQTSVWFAPSPRCFSHSSEIIPIKQASRRSGIMTTSMGIQLTIRLVSRMRAAGTTVNDGLSECYGVLNCRFKNDPLHCVGIRLEGAVDIGYNRKPAIWSPDEDREWRSWRLPLQRISHDEAESGTTQTTTILADNRLLLSLITSYPTGKGVEVHIDATVLTSAGFERSNILRGDLAMRTFEEGCFVTWLGAANRMGLFQFRHPRHGQDVSVLLSFGDVGKWGYLQWDDEEEIQCGFLNNSQAAVFRKSAYLKRTEYAPQGWDRSWSPPIAHSKDGSSWRYVSLKMATKVCFGQRLVSVCLELLDESQFAALSPTFLVDRSTRARLQYRYHNMLDNEA